jgi:hypothetical protein
LLLTQVLQRLDSQFLGSRWIAGLLKKQSLGLLDEGMRGRVKGIEVFAEPQGVELITALLYGLC